MMSISFFLLNKASWISIFKTQSRLNGLNQWRRLIDNANVCEMIIVITLNHNLIERKKIDLLIGGGVYRRVHLIFQIIWSDLLNLKI